MCGRCPLLTECVVRSVRVCECAQAARSGKYIIVYRHCVRHNLFDSLRNGYGSTAKGYFGKAGLHRVAHCGLSASGDDLACRFP